MLVVISCLVALISLNGVWAEDVDFTGRIVVSALHIQYLGERANWEKALSSAIAIESGVSTKRINSLTITSNGGDGLARIVFRVKAPTSMLAFTAIERKFLAGADDGTLANTVSITGEDNGAEYLIGTSVVQCTITDSWEETRAPTASPTYLTPTRFDELLDENYIFVSILGSILGVFMLYWAYWGAVYAYQAYNDYQDRLESEMQAKLEAANERLTKKFHKHVDNPAPHASDMRKNFQRQFGKSPRAADGTFTASTVGNDDSDDEEQGKGLQLNKVTVGMDRTPKARSPNSARSPGSGGVDGGIYSGIRKPGVQAGGKSPKGQDSESKGTPSKTPKLDLSAHARSPSILQVSRPEDSSGFDSTAARLRQGGGGPRQYGFSNSPASPGKR